MERLAYFKKNFNKNEDIGQINFDKIKALQYFLRFIYPTQP